MKKGKVFGKGQIIAGLMVIALGAAIWLNVKFTSKEKYVGEATYVYNSSSKTVQTSAKADTADYFKSAVKEREAALEEAKETIAETLKSEKLTDSQSRI